MSWHDEVIDRLIQVAVGGYTTDGPPATEPTALACAALAAAQQLKAARKAASWLIECQQDSGAIGISVEQDSPCWPTSLAILGWMAIQRATNSTPYQESIEAAVESTLSLKGETSARIKEVGHDTTLCAWPWVVGTHSWMEPTAFAVLALKSTGRGEHPRVREAVEMMVDRQFAEGGCNYGNTFVLQQELVPHVQSTGVVLLALADERASSRIAQSVSWLESEWPNTIGLPSWCFAAQALCAFDRRPDDLMPRLESEWNRISKGGQGTSTYQLALLALAAAEPSSNPLAASAWQPRRASQP